MSGNAGLTCDLSPHWGLAAWLTYAPLASTAHIDIAAAASTRLSSSSSRLSQNALVTALLLNYHFCFPEARRRRTFRKCRWRRS